MKGNPFKPVKRDEGSYGYIVLFIVGLGILFDSVLLVGVVTNNGL